MEYLLYLATKSRHAHNAGGFNVSSDGMDLIDSLLFYSA